MRLHVVLTNSADHCKRILRILFDFIHPRAFRLHDTDIIFAIVYDRWSTPGFPTDMRNSRPAHHLTTQPVNVLEEFRFISNDQDLHGSGVSVCTWVRQFASHGSLPDAIRQHVSFQKRSPKTDQAPRFRKSQFPCRGQLLNGNRVC